MSPKVKVSKKVKPCRHTWRETMVTTGMIPGGNGVWMVHPIYVEVCPDCLKIRNRKG